MTEAQIEKVANRIHKVQFGKLALSDCQRIARELAPLVDEMLREHHQPCSLAGDNYLHGVASVCHACYANTLAGKAYGEAQCERLPCGHLRAELVQTRVENRRRDWSAGYTPERRKHKPWLNGENRRTQDAGGRCLACVREHKIRNEAYEAAAKIADLWNTSCRTHENDPCCHVRTAKEIGYRIRALESPAQEKPQSA